MADKKLIAARRKKMWIVDPHCERCGVLTVLPCSLTGPAYRYKDGTLRVQPDNMATIQHKYFKGHHLREVERVPGDRRWLLWCYKCNRDYNKYIEQPIQRILNIFKSENKL